MKYKVGDKIVITSMKYGHRYDIGEIVTIKYVGTTCYIIEEGLHYSIWDEECKKYEYEPNYEIY